MSPTYNGNRSSPFILYFYYLLLDDFLHIQWISQLIPSKSSQIFPCCTLWNLCTPFFSFNDGLHLVLPVWEWTSRHLLEQWQPQPLWVFACLYWNFDGLATYMSTNWWTPTENAVSNRNYSPLKKIETIKFTGKQLELKKFTLTEVSQIHLGFCFVFCFVFFLSS